MYRAPFIILYYDQQMHNYFTNCHTPTRFDTRVSSTGNLKSIPCQVTQLFQMQLLVIQFTINTFTAIVDLGRSNFSIARTPLFQLKSAM